MNYLSSFLIKMFPHSGLNGRHIHYIHTYPFKTSPDIIKWFGSFANNGFSSIWFGFGFTPACHCYWRLWTNFGFFSLLKIMFLFRLIAADNAPNNGVKHRFWQHRCIENAAMPQSKHTCIMLIAHCSWCSCSMWIFTTKSAKIFRGAPITIIIHIQWNNSNDCNRL